MNIEAINSTGYQKALKFSGTKDIETAQKVSSEPLYVDCTNLYSAQEIRDIRNQVGAPNYDMFGPSNYSVMLFNTGALVIKNNSMTNDTVEISPDGSARHVGSWHNNLLGKKEEYIGFIETAKQKLETCKKD